MVSTSATIRRIGNSQGLIIEKGICEEMGIGVGSSVDIILEGGCMTVMPIKGGHAPRIGAAKGHRLAPDSWFDEEIDDEIAAMMGALP